MAKTKKLKPIKLLNNIVQVGSKIEFKEKVQSINKNSIGFVVNQNLFNGKDLRVLFNENSTYEEPKALLHLINSNKECYNNLIIHTTVLLTRLGKSGKPRFEFKTVKLPVFNGSVLKGMYKTLEDNLKEDSWHTYGSGLKETYNHLFLKDTPIITYINDNNEFSFNDAPNINVINNNSSKDFVIWASCRINHVNFILRHFNDINDLFTSKYNTSKSHLFKDLTNCIPPFNLSPLLIALYRLSNLKITNLETIEPLITLFNDKKVRHTIVTEIQYMFAKISRSKNVYVEHNIRNLLMSLAYVQKELKKYSKSKKYSATKEYKEFKLLEVFLLKSLLTLQTPPNSNNINTKLLYDLNKRFL